MSIARLLTQTATLVHREPSGSDAEGNTTFGTATTTTYPCRLEQIQSRGASTAGSDETVAGETRTTTEFVLFLPAAAIGEGFEDQINVDGAPYEVIGQPQALRTPRGVHHIESRVRRVSR